MLSSLAFLLGFAATLTDAYVHQVSVGEGGTLKFTPNVTTALVGDSIEFKFYNGSGSHSVVSGSYESPCTPASDGSGFFSGYIPGDSNGNPTFTWVVTTNSPTFFYCSLGTHCQKGMVGVVNPSGQSIDGYEVAAAQVAKASAPTGVTGGVLGGVSASTAAQGGTTTILSGSGSSTATIPITMTGSPSANGNVTATTGSVVGIATATGNGNATVTGGSPSGAASSASSNAASIASSVKSAISSAVSSSRGASSATATATATASEASVKDLPVILALGAILGGMVVMIA